MQFKEWSLGEISEPMDAYDLFLEKLFESEINILEHQGPASMMAEFILQEAKSPWGNETWLDGIGNSKIIKSKSVDAFERRGKKVLFVPYIINLLPAKQSGINLCVCATKHCASTCLHSAGAVQYLINKTLGRLRKTWFIALDREKAFGQIVKQIENKKKEVDELNRKSDKEHYQMIVRLNGTSDLVWRAMTDKNGRNVFDMFPDIVFYDYSKQMKEMDHFIKGEIIDEKGNNLGKFPPNYHLTLSYGGKGGNMNDYKRTLEAGENLAVPFGPGKTSSLDYMEFPKDMHDLLKKIYYPDYVRTKREKEAYKESIIDKIKEDGSFVGKEELAAFAGQTLLPGLFMCHEVVNGDDHDARFLDDRMLDRMNAPNGEDEDRPRIKVDNFERKKKPHGVVVGLTAKGDLSFSAYKGPAGWDLSHSGFMVGPEDSEMNSPCRPMLNNPSKEPFLRKKTEVYKKVVRAIMVARNFDARHAQAYDKDENGNQRTHVLKSPGAKKGTQTYMSAKGRATKEMNELIDIIQTVMRGEEPASTFVGKRKSAAMAATRLRDYIQRPEIIQMLNDESFKEKARELGIDINFESLARLSDMSAKRDPEAPKPTLFPSSMLRTLANKEQDGRDADQ